MLTFVNGNLFNSNCNVLVNATNKVGIMGGGIALAFKKMFPKMYKEYKNICDNNTTNKYYNIFCDKRIDNNKQHIIICFHTKYHPSNDSDLNDIDCGLEKLSNDILTIPGLKELSYAFPALGCGLGGLNWQDVKNLFVKHFSRSEFEKVEIKVYEPI